MVRRPRQRPDPAGYALVALVVIVAVMNVLVAASLPYWSQVVKRDKEAELIFRGLQYAEAIRVFQKSFNRLPNTLDELIEVNPRSIRRLWKDPMTESGEWDLVRATAGRGGAGQTGGQTGGQDLARGTAPGDGREDEEGSGPQGPAAGPIVGVQSRSDDEALRTFMGATSYSKWQFTVDLIPVPVTIPDTLLVPRPTSDWVGKPFRQDLQPQQGGMPGQEPGGQQRGEDDDG